ncbi:MAG: hypothetical protein ACYC6J_02670 [Coriobacteriia bacterium]
MTSSTVVDVDALVARIRARAAATAPEAAHPGILPPFSERFRGVDSEVRRELDRALQQDVSYSTAAVGSLLWIRRPIKGFLRRLWAKQSRFNDSLLWATIGMNDKMSALAAEVETLELRLAALESRSMMREEASKDIDGCR